MKKAMTDGKEYTMCEVYKQSREKAEEYYQKWREERVQEMRGSYQQSKDRIVEYHKERHQKGD